MTDDLYFFPLIAAALRSDNPEASLRYAFDRIRAQGQLRRYCQGLDQFDRFMHLVHEHAQIVLNVTRDGNPIGSIRLAPGEEGGSITGIVSGRYTICLSTGRLLWEGDIHASDLCWAMAFPGQPLALAADTKGTPKTPSRKESICDGLLLVVFPGIESGELRIVNE